MQWATTKLSPHFDEIKKRDGVDATAAKDICGARDGRVGEEH